MVLILETTRREDAFCNHVVGQQEVMMVPDALLDERFVNKPLVTSGPSGSMQARPARPKTGDDLGYLCVIGQESEELSSDQQEIFQALFESLF